METVNWSVEEYLFYSKILEVNWCYSPVKNVKVLLSPGSSYNVNHRVIGSSVNVVHLHITLYFT